jgi:hypothetical protein
MRDFGLGGAAGPPGEQGGAILGEHSQHPLKLASIHPFAHPLDLPAVTGRGPLALRALSMQGSAFVFPIHDVEHAAPADAAYAEMDESALRGVRRTLG